MDGLFQPTHLMAHAIYHTQSPSALHTADNTRYWQNKQQVNSN